MSNRKAKNKTKGLISLALYSLLLRKNYEDISVKEICERAGVSRMSFYRYYNKKDDIFVDYCDARFEEFYEGVKDQTNRAYSRLAVVRTSSSVTSRSSVPVLLT